jgi:hypothetical protein
MEDEETYEEAFILNKTEPHDVKAALITTEFNSSNYSKDELDKFQSAAEKLFNQRKITKIQFDQITYSIQKNLDRVPQVSRGRSRSRSPVRRRSPVRPPALGPRGRRPSRRRRSSGSPTGVRPTPSGGTRRMRKSKKSKTSKKYTHKRK